MGAEVPSRTKSKVRKKTTKVIKPTRMAMPEEIATVKEKPEGYVFGRPTKYLPEMCQTAFEGMKRGLSKEAVAGLLEIDKVTLYEWVKKYPDFSNAIAKGERASQLFFEEIGIKHLTHTKNGTQLNSQVWALNMKNRFGWSEKKEVDHGIKEDTKNTLAFDLSIKPKHKD